MNIRNSIESRRADDQEISNGITKARRIIACLNGILWSKNITKKKEFDMYKSDTKYNALWMRNMETN